MEKTLIQEAQELIPALETIFCTLHEHPELGNEETQTSSLIRRRLEDLGIQDGDIVSLYDLEFEYQR